MSEKYSKITSQQLEKLRSIEPMQIPGLIAAEEDLSSRYGKPGTSSRIDFENKAQAWYYGEIFRERRKALGLTQKELAERIGRERTYINRIEKGETDMQLSTFLRIASALGISMQLFVNM